MEARTLAGMLFEPTNQEQLFLELLNAARANPVAYGDSVGVDLFDVAASPPLAFNPQLIQSARGHSEDMSTRDYFGHCTPIDPTIDPGHLCDTGNVKEDPGDRIDAAGYPWLAYGESIAAGYSTDSDALAALIIDTGISDLGHRKHLLAIDSISATLPEVGIGIVQGGSGSLRDYYTIDSARDFACSEDGTCDLHSIFLTGVVYSDLDHNNFYSPGEGFGGVSIHVQGGGVDVTATTFASGGYSVPLPAGTASDVYTVTVSGGDFPGTVTTTVGGCSVNLKLDILPGGPVGGTCGPPNTAAAELGVVWSGVWRIDRNGNGSWNGRSGGDLSVRFGRTRSDVPVPMDWNGDGRDELAVFRRGRNLLVDSNRNRRWDGVRHGDTLIVLGNGGDQAVLGDWNGDGRDDLGVLRNESGMFHLDTNGDRVLDASDSTFQFDTFQRGDLAIVGDWNGDGQDDIGLFRGGNTFMLDTNGNHTWDGPSVDSQFTVQVAPARPAPADYNGDGKTDIAVFSRNTFYIDTDNDGILDTTHVFTTGRYPVAGNWV